MVGVNGLQCPRVPPYYVFCPTDEQLIVYYLGNYVAGRPLPYDGIIGSADVYGTEPYNLLPSPLKRGDEAYFFSPRTRGKRTAGGGTWRLESKEDIADGDGEVVGHKGTLSFRSSHNTRKATGWVMHEYVLGDQDDDRANFKPVALYRIHRKASKEDKDQESPVATPDQEPEQRPATIGSLMALPAPEPTVTIDYQNNSCYDVVLAPPIDDHNGGGFSSEPSATAGYSGGFFESHATVRSTNTIGSSVASQAPVTIEDQSNRCYDVTVAPPTDDQNHAGFSSEPATEEYNGGFFESFATVQPTSMIGSSMASSALITGDSDGLFESYAAVQPTSGTSMASLAAPEAAASLENGISDDGNGLLSEIDKNPQEVADASEIPTAGVASDGAETGVLPEPFDDLVTIEELLGSFDVSSGADELDAWPDVSSMVGWAF